ncbi:MAG: hypothetical protein H8F28_21425 [Fibrella sp.]|nr:hypothetical protein [Armatimonadota bacterium]
MFDRFRMILLVPSLLIFLYGGWMFWSGKVAVDEQRRTAKPREATLDDIVLNPPRKNGEWYRITDGGASIPRSVMEEYDSGPNRVANAPFFLYAPILRDKDVAKAETVAQLSGGKPPVIVVLRSQNKEHGKTYRAMRQLQSADYRTTDEWLAQNHKQVIIQPPFTGLLIRRSISPLQNSGPSRVNADYLQKGWILLEGKKPMVGENAQVALGLGLLMGIPTVWLFGLLFAGKLDPPDDDPFPISHPAKAASTTVAVPDAFVMPSETPVAEDSVTKTPRR